MTHTYNSKNATVTYSHHENATIQAVNRTRQKTKPMKTRLNIVLAILFATFYMAGFAADDDCPCRKKVKIIIEKPVVKVIPAPVKQYKTYQLFPKGFEVPDPNMCAGGMMRPKENLQFRIMPNPVDQTLNVIYTTAEPGNVKIEILDCSGAVLRTLMQEYQEDGLKVRSFDVYNKIRPGIAYVRVSNNGQVLIVEKMFKQ